MVETNTGQEIEHGLGEWKNERGECNGLAAALVRMELFKQELDSKQATWLSRPGKGKILDVSFTPKKSFAGNGDFVGVDVMGRPACIGMVFRPEEVPHEEVERAIRDDGQIGPLMDQGARVVIVTKRDLEHWNAFYGQVAESGLHEELGKKVMSYSGLGRTDKEYADRFAAVVDELMKNDLEKSAGERVEFERRGKFDRAFVDEDNKLVGVGMHHVRVAELQGEILVERVLSEEVIVPGFVVRKPGESKREAYKRARNLRTYHKNRFGDRRLEVPVVSEGQLSIWKKLGRWEEMGSYLPNTDLTVEQVIRFLYLGESNIASGELAKMGFSLPSRGRVLEGVDVLFMKGGEQKEPNMTLVDGMLGMNLSKKKNKEEGYLALGRVSGIIILPEEWTTKEMRQHVDRVAYKANYETGGPDTHLLYLTKSLFEEWKMRGTACVDNGENDYSSPEQRREYGYEQNGSSVSLALILRQLKPQIGGQNGAIEVKYEDGSTRLVLMDLGTSFVGARALQDMTARSTTSIGLNRHFYTGDLAMVPGAYDTEYLVAGIKNFSALKKPSRKDPVVSYVRAELRRRVPIENVLELLDFWNSKGKVVKKMTEADVRRIYKLGERDEKLWYGDGEQVVSDLLLSHAHIDHAGRVPFLSRDVRVSGTLETMSHLTAMTNKGRTWADKYDHVSLIAHPKNGSAYHKVYREMNPIYWGGQRVNIGDGLSAAFYPVDHSMSGTSAVAIRDARGEGLLLYTADLKPGDLTNQTIEKIGGEFSKILSETTNLDDSEKPSAGVTEKMVEETLFREIDGASQKVVIVVVPPNHLQRLTEIMSVASQVGRKVALGPSHAELIQQMRVSREMSAPLGADGFDVDLPELGIETSLWWPPATNPGKYRGALFDKAAAGPMGVVDGDRLSGQKGKWIVVVDPYRIFDNEFVGADFGWNKLLVLHSSYFPYQAHAKWLVGGNMKWVKSRGGQYNADFTVLGDGGTVINKPNYGPGSAGGKKSYGLHASGHATFEEMVEILRGLVGGDFRGHELIFTHGMYPEKYEAALRKRLGMDEPSKLKIVSRLPRYDPERPISRPGARIPLR